ncbi:hypothetical protein H5410_012300 [Solanum commersonii]|uniref:Uncharacterized protein n=1 Tax=Solanum commersonii TaxID=4109 RepID=A0A9J6AS83_SOLCO|nr:hypothetical protein H5410_012300 [Solanum commersonii]
MNFVCHLSPEVWYLRLNDVIFDHFVYVLHFQAVGTCSHCSWAGKYTSADTSNLRLGNTLFWASVHPKMDPPFDMTSQVTSGSEGNHRSRSNLIRFQQDSRYKMNIGHVDITISFKDQSVTRTRLGLKSYKVLFIDILLMVTTLRVN